MAITEMQAEAAVTARTVLRDFDGETGKAVGMDDDGETVIVHIVSEGFSRWSDILDLTPADDLASCGRCNRVVDKADIAETGPYRTCPPCTPIVRG